MDSSTSEFNWVAIRDTLDNISTHSVFKLLVSLVVTTWGWLFSNSVELIIVVASLVLLDTVTGFWKAMRVHQVSSRGFFRFSAKLVVYFVLLATASLVDKSLPIRFSLSIMGTFLAITEGISILENIAKLGFPVPTRLIRLLKEQNEDKKDGSGSSLQDKK